MNKSVIELEQHLATPTVQKKINSVIHSSVDIKKFCRSVMVAASNPDSAISTCERTSLVNALTNCAQDGLIPDGNEAAIVGYYDKKTGVINAKYTPMVAGVIKIILRDASIRRLVAECVYENDVFHYDVADPESFSHKPNWFGERGDMVGAYAMAEKHDGTKIFEALNMEQIIHIRSCAKKDFVWAKWTSEMARKSAVHRLSKYILVDSDIMQRDKDDYDFSIEPDNIKPVKEVVDINKELGLIGD